MEHSRNTREALSRGEVWASADEDFRQSRGDYPNIFFRAFLLTVAIVVLAGCQSSSPTSRTMEVVPQLDADAARAVGLSALQVTDATELYTIKCAKCHKFYDAAQYSQSDWDDWMRKMSRKSKLKPAQEELLRRYLGAYRATHR